MNICWGDSWGDSWEASWGTPAPPEVEPDYAALVCWQIWQEDKWADLDHYNSSIVGEAIVGEAIVGGQLNTTWATIRPCQNDTGNISHV